MRSASFYGSCNWPFKVIFRLLRVWSLNCGQLAPIAGAHASEEPTADAV